MPTQDKFSVSPTAKTSSVNTDAILTYLKAVKSIRRRDGRIENFKADKIKQALKKAFTASGFAPEKAAADIDRVFAYVMHNLSQEFDGHTVPSAEEVHGIVGAA